LKRRGKSSMGYRIWARFLML